MDTYKNYDVTVESGIISIFQRQVFKLDRVFAEYVDNSLQSFLDHKETLEKLADGKKCTVSILCDNEKIVIKDNAYGMEDEDFARALKLKATNPNAFKINQLSVYGMGLKYASVYLGDHYSISSTAYQSNSRYFAEVDVPTFEKNNPKTVQAKISSDFPDLHETIITINDLRIKMTTDKIKDLREKLGIIYNHYIHNGLLSISINNIPVEFHRPELRPKDDGGYYFENFNDSFTVSGKQYDFTGWIAILNKGDQSITGLNLVQANRCIELGYKPEKIFGKGNSFQNSRIIGEIVFSGENYVLSFNKDKFVWVDDGAEDIFLNKLFSNESVHYIIKKSKELSFTDDEKKIKNKTTKPFKNNNAITQVDSKGTEDVKLSKDKAITNKDNTNDSSLINKTTAETVIESDDTATKDDIIKYIIETKDKQISLYVCTKKCGINEDWLRFDKYNDGYLATINFENAFINNNFKNQESKAATNAIAILLVTSMVKSQNLGLKLTDSLLLLKTLNQLMGKTNE